MESEAFLIGIWKNFEDLEESLTLEELTEVVTSCREREYRTMKFQAAMKGVDLDEYNDKEGQFNEMKIRAEAMATGKPEDEVRFADFGIAVISEFE